MTQFDLDKYKTKKEKQEEKKWRKEEQSDDQPSHGC
jgi:hypothetical protein